MRPAKLPKMGMILEKKQVQGINKG